MQLQFDHPTLLFRFLPLSGLSQSAGADGLLIPTMNPSNQVTLPLALVNLLMTAIQAQPVSGHVSGVSSASQQTDGIPTLLHGLQRRSIPAPPLLPQLSGQQWIVQSAAALQPSGSQSDAPASQLSADELRIVNAVMAALRPATQGSSEQDKVIPAVFVPDDERVLADALRKAKAEGLTPLEGFAKLDKVSRSPSRPIRILM